MSNYLVTITMQTDTPLTTDEIEALQSELIATLPVIDGFDLRIQQIPANDKEAVDPARMKVWRAGPQ